MAISFVGRASNSAANGADVTVTLPAGTTTDDLVVVAYAVGDNDNTDFNMAMVTTGYTEVADLFANDDQETNLGVFWKVMGATPDTSFTVDGLGGADASVAAVCHVYRGVDTTTPMDVTPTGTQGLNTNRPNPPSIDHLNPAGLWTVAIGAFAHTSATSSVTVPTNYNSADSETRSQDDTTDITVAIAYRTNPADPEDPGIFTPGIADNVAHSWCAATLALRPADTTRRAHVSWTELETPNAPRRAHVSWAEMETPNAPRRAQVSWAEFETPDSASRRAHVSWAELETPNAPRRAQVSWAEFETPNAPRRAQLSWAEMEVPNAPRRAQLSWAEFEVPEVGGAVAVDLITVLSRRWGRR